MRGARYYRPDVETRLDKCSEHIGDDCNDCCGVTPCRYCLELEVYGEDIVYGLADDPDSTKHWTGTVGGHTFDAFWERNYETDVCEFVVELDGVEVYRKSCYEGQECRDSSDETAVVIGYDDATLRWQKHEPLKLPHIIGDAGCPTWFCGECECSCESVCITITEPDGTVIRGELSNVAYECEGPRWEGQIGYYDLALALGRDSYGNCVLESSVDGEEQEAVAVTGCKDMGTTITLYDGTTIAVACKICSCEEDEVHPPCCDRTDIPDTLYATITGLVNCTCNDWIGFTLALTRNVFTQSAGLSRWGGCGKGPCTTINGVGTDQGISLILECTEGAIGQGGSPIDLSLYMINGYGDSQPCPANTAEWDALEYGPGFFTPVTGPEVPPSTCRPLVLVCRFSNDEFSPRCQDPMSPPGVSEVEWTITE